MRTRTRRGVAASVVSGHARAGAAGPAARTVDFLMRALAPLRAGRRRTWLATLLALAALAGGAAQAQPRAVPALPAATEAGASPALRAVYADAREATVRIETTPRGVGSGFVIAEDGLVMTAYHVVRDARSLRVVLADGRRFAARIVGFDEYSDRALLDVDASGLPILPIAAEDRLLANEEVVAIGNSRGDTLAPRYGRVTALGRSLSPSFPTDMVALTVPLAPGDSGGPILNAEGHVIGIATAVSVSSGAFSSYATPLYGSVALDVVAALQDGQRRSAPFLGVSTIELTAESVAALGYGRPGALLVVGVLAGHAAEAAGVREPVELDTRAAPGGRPTVLGARRADVIVAVDGRRVRGHDSLVAYLRSREVGDVVELTLVRDGREVVVRVTLGARAL